MRRKGHISPHIETKRNFELAFDGFSEHKKSRESVRKFEENLSNYIEELLPAYVNGTWKTSEYVEELIHEIKTRRIAKLPVKDHVMQWASCLHVEPLLCSTFIRNSCSCVKGRGTHDFVNLLRSSLYSDYEGTYYFVQMDIHHFFPNIHHDLMKEQIRLKIKDPKLLAFLDEFIDSYYQGLPLGVKISQILANFFLAPFDRLAISVFGILSDPEKLAYWTSRYITHCIVTCRTKKEEEELSKGAVYLGNKFKSYLKEGLKYYFRFADNIVIMHSDKAFLHIVTELSIMVLTRDYLLPVNKSWNVRPVHAGGIDVCGYVSFHDHRKVRKRNKRALCRDVAKQRKKGLSPEEIRQKCSSRIGFVQHADSKTLLRKLNINMEKRLGNVMKERRVQLPFKGMKFDQKKAFSEIVCKIGMDEKDFKIMLLDFTFEDSKIEKEDVIVEVSDGNGGTKQEKKTQPKKCLVIRYKRILETTTQTAIDGEETETYVFEKVKDKDGNPTAKDAEYYSYTGSAVMIEQAAKDFTKEDLPCPTVVKEFVNKMNKKFYKFT